MVKFMRDVRQNAALREDWKSHDELNPQVGRLFTLRNPPNFHQWRWAWAGAIPLNFLFIDSSSNTRWTPKIVGRGV